MVEDASGSIHPAAAPSSNMLHTFLTGRADHARQRLETTAAAADEGDLQAAVAHLRDLDDGALMYLNPMLPWNANQSEISKEIWLSTPQHRLDDFLPIWDARGGAPIRVATMCSGTDAPVHAMRNQAFHWNTALDNSFGDAAQPSFFHHILSCDCKLTARRFIYSNSPPPLCFNLSQDLHNGCFIKLGLGFLQTGNCSTIRHNRV
jgi:hypothetical protein